MPHLHIDTFKEIEFPQTKDSISFNFLAKNPNHSGESLISAAMDGDDFFLLVNESEEKNLLKSDKLTRPASTYSVHKALLAYASLAALDVKDSNVPDVKRKWASWRKYST